MGKCLITKIFPLAHLVSIKCNEALQHNIDIMNFFKEVYWKKQNKSERKNSRWPSSNESLLFFLMLICNAFFQLLLHFLYALNKICSYFLYAAYSSSYCCWLWLTNKTQHNDVKLEMAFNFNFNRMKFLATTDVINKYPIIYLLYSLSIELLTLRFCTKFHIRHRLICVRTILLFNTLMLKVDTDCNAKKIKSHFVMLIFQNQNL